MEFQEKPEDKPESCYFCHGDVNADEDWCSGCGEYVCVMCDLDSPMGHHDVEEHRASA